jgi:hypothetical protein
LALYFIFCNFMRVHRTLRMSPEMAAGISDTLWTMDDIVERMKARRPQLGKRGRDKKEAA